MTIPFTPSNWYWIVNGNEAQVYSSAAGDYVAANNAAYQAWIASGGVATRIASEAELGDVLAPYALRPTASGVLDGYTDSQATKLTIETVAKVAFNHENRIRVLEGKAAFNAAQFKAALKALM